MILFYIVVTPIGVLFRLFGKNFLELKNKSQDSYWNHRDRLIEENQNYENQY